MFDPGCVQKAKGILVKLQEILMGVEKESNDITRIQVSTIS